MSLSFLVWLVEFAGKVEQLLLDLSSDLSAHNGIPLVSRHVLVLNFLQFYLFTKRCTRTWTVTIMIGNPTFGLLVPCLKPLELVSHHPSFYLGIFPLHTFSLWLWYLWPMLTWLSLGKYTFKAWKWTYAWIMSQQMEARTQLSRIYELNPWLANQYYLPNSYAKGVQ